MANVIQRHDQRFQRLIEQSSDAIALLSAEGVILYASPSTERILGYPPDAFVGHPSSEFSDPDGPRPSPEESARFLRTPGAILRTEARIRHQDGSWRWIEVTLSNLLHDPVIGALVGNYRDITDRKRIEAERDAERSRLWQILNVLPEAVLVVDAAGTIVLTNTAATVLLGSRDGARMRQNEAEESRFGTSRLDGTPLPLAEMPLYRSLHGGETVLGEQVVIRPGGGEREVPCLVSSAPLWSDAGSIIGAITAFQDITAIKQFERSREEFVSSVSHDLKTPLTALLMLTQMTKRQLDRLALPGVAPIVEQQEMAEAAIGRMTGMVDELLDITRLQLGQPLPIDRWPTDIVELVRSCVDELQRTTDRHVLHLETTVDKLVWPLDQRRFQRVVENLLSNAIKYSPNGGTIVVRLERTVGEEVLLSIRDPGLGIPAAALPLVFTRHYRAPNVIGVIEGTGLGLATVREIVERHGGTINVASREGHGSTFTVRLPDEK